MICTDAPIPIGGNLLNTRRLITDFPEHACVEVPCLVDGAGLRPTRVVFLPPVLAAMNMTNSNPQLLTIHAAHTCKPENILRVVMLELRCVAELTLDERKSMMGNLIEAHGFYMTMYSSTKEPHKRLLCYLSSYNKKTLPLFPPLNIHSFFDSGQTMATEQKMLSSESVFVRRKQRREQL